MKELKTDFFKRDTIIVAKELVGKILCVNNVRGRIIEVEAYKEDKASHARKETPRSKLMRESFGRVYVYLVYGMYHCLNFTTDTKPGAVLIRALNVEGCEGPGKLCKVLRINSDDNGEIIGKRIKIFCDEYVPKIKRTERIGIKEDVHLKWRFLDEKN